MKTRREYLIEEFKKAYPFSFRAAWDWFEGGEHRDEVMKAIHQAQLDMQEKCKSNVLIAIEFGFRQCEKGHNLQKTLEMAELFIGRHIKIPE